MDPSKTAFPSKQDVVDFIRDSPGPVGKREIARAFQLTGADRVPLKRMLKEIEDEGLVERGRGRKVAPPKSLPEVTVLVVTGLDSDGETLARPVKWEHETPPPRVVMAPERRGHPALTEGDRVLARLRRDADGVYEGRTIRRLGEAPGPTRIIGVFRRGPGGGTLEPAEKRAKETYRVAESDRGGADDGDLVVAEAAHGPRFGPRRATVVERLGAADAPEAISLVAIHAAGIPTEFPRAAIEQAEAAVEAPLGDRTDLRAVPLVTIDGPDARDFDDAVWAEPDPDPANAGGWQLIVAIADVGHYVPGDSPLDREAFRRGNSCYFPDRVVPMLPEALSNGLCSLKPGAPRACLAAHLWIDRDGHLRRHRFVRGLMRSAARLTYEQIQTARNGQPDDTTGPLMDAVIHPLYGAFAALAAARAERGTLELDLPERKVQLDEQGRVAGIAVRQRLDSHRLIEEFMIAANVAAAQTLAGRGHPCLYRIHDAPDRARLEALREFLAPLGYRLAKGQVPRPRVFTQLLKQAEGRPEAETVNQMVLRSQAQAVYSAENIGHFGLALPQYAHFTSPIRRYADLTVHRALIRVLRLGAGGAHDEELARLDGIGEHISFTERRANEAERDAMDRYVAGFLSDQVGQVLEGRISGVTRFGLFVTLHETGADGLVPISTLPDDYYEHDERRHALVGRSWGRVFRLGSPVRARVMEADRLSGSTVFRLVDADDGADWLGEPVTPSAAGAGRLPRSSVSGRKGAARAAGPRRKGRRP